MKLRRLFNDQHGDTLIEVTMALSILAVVLTSGFLTANRAYILGQNARERTEIINLAQAQAEQLKNFRDIHTWNGFIGAIPSGSTGFHMLANGSPASGPVSAISTNGSISINTVSVDPANKFAKFIIVYVLQPRGGGVPATNRIPVELANLDGIFQ